MKQALDFAPHLVPAIEAGLKRSAIRIALGNARDPEAGDALALHVEFRGFPWRPGRLIGTTVVEESAEVVILPAARTAQIMLGHELLDELRADHVAKVEGFASALAMTEWFAARYGLPFSGRITVWAPLPPVVHRLQ